MVMAAVMTGNALVSVIVPLAPAPVKRMVSPALATPMAERSEQSVLVEVAQSMAKTPELSAVVVTYSVVAEAVAVMTAMIPKVVRTRRKSTIGSLGGKH